MTLLERVEAAVDRAPVVDLHTHLFAPEFSSLNLWGIDELLTYHYLVAETLRAEPEITPEAFFARTKSEQADLVWDSLFVRRTPLSEATVGVITSLSALGIDPSLDNLNQARAYFADVTSDQHLENVLRLAGVSSLTMTNDPLDPAERPYWDAGTEPDPRFHAALRIDPLVNSWTDNVDKLAKDGYAVNVPLDPETLAEVRRFFEVWIARMRPRYLAVSLPDTFEFPEDSFRSRILTGAVLPACRDHGLPFAMMIGVRRGVNPRLRGAGDGMGVADLSAIERMAEAFPDNRFLVTTLAQANVHDLCVSARKFANILPFGCWWFMNNPSLVEQTTRLRLEMLGPTFVPQHSDARILDQLIYKWRHTRTSVAAALTSRYIALERAGLRVSDEKIERDARDLMGGIAANWLGVTA